MKRLDLNATTHDEATNYLRNRAIQMLKFDARLTGVQVYEEGVVGLLEHEDKKYQSVYVLKQHRGKGSYKKLFEKLNLPILTSDECRMEEFLKAKEYPYVCFTIEESEEYKLVQEFYGDGKARRSQVYFMNHIDEGLAVLEWIGASNQARAGYCLHPLVQADENLAGIGAFDLSKVDPVALVNTVEYRSVANEYLSRRNISSLEEIRLSPLKDVNDMLIADKIQNRKDFELYHQNHPRHDALRDYFHNWLNRLDISEDQYQDFKARLMVPGAQSLLSHGLF